MKALIYLEAACKHLQVPDKIKVNPVGRIISEVNKAYLAGLFDGDGAIMALIQRHPEKKFGFRIRVIIKITQKDPKILKWIKKEFGIGDVVVNRTTNEWIV